MSVTHHDHMGSLGSSISDLQSTAETMRVAVKNSHSRLEIKVYTAPVVREFPHQSPEEEHWKAQRAMLTAVSSTFLFGIVASTLLKLSLLPELRFRGIFAASLFLAAVAYVAMKQWERLMDAPKRFVRPVLSLQPEGIELFTERMKGETDVGTRIRLPFCLIEMMKIVRHTTSTNELRLSAPRVLEVHSYFLEPKGLFFQTHSGFAFSFGSDLSHDELRRILRAIEAFHENYRSDHGLGRGISASEAEAFGGQLSVSDTTKLRLRVPH